MADQLLAWLRAALDAAEQRAHGASYGLHAHAESAWTLELGQRRDADGAWADCWTVVAGNHVRLYAPDASPASERYAQFAALDDPAHAKAVIATHRRVLDRHGPAIEADAPHDRVCATCGDTPPCDDVRDLVGIYRRQHPGFDPDWLSGGQS